MTDTWCAPVEEEKSWHSAKNKGQMALDITAGGFFYCYEPVLVMCRRLMILSKNGTTIRSWIIESNK